MFWELGAFSSSTGASSQSSFSKVVGILPLICSCFSEAVRGKGALIVVRHDHTLGFRTSRLTLHTR